MMEIIWKREIYIKRLYNFLQKKVLVETNNKLIILDNASTNKNKKLKL